MRVLIIWEDVGERTRLYEELMTAEEFKKASAAHGNIIGLANQTAVANEALDYLNRWLKDRKPFYDTEYPEQPIREIAACSVIHTGFVP